MNTNAIKITQYSESSILVRFDQKPSKRTLRFLVSLVQLLKIEIPKVILDVNFSYNSLLIQYVIDIDNFYDIKNDILELISSLNIDVTQEYRRLTLPVCYNEDFGVDLKQVSSYTNLSINEIIALHTSTSYLVYFIGFLPGFPYLLNLPKALHCPRKDVPRQQIEKGSVGIGGSQTGVYPHASPGGWQIIGNCPIDIYGNNWQDNTLLKPTDELCFQSVNLDEYLHYKDQFLANDYTPNIELYG